MEYTVGIDLGTTYSCIALVNPDGTVEVLPNKNGNRVTPSYVAFTDTERIVGDGAKNQELTNIENTIFDSKRLIGQAYDAVTTQDYIKRWPFKVENDGENSPQIKVFYKGKSQSFYPEHISSMVLEELTLDAENHLQKVATSAVITVPANFTDKQRKATKLAAKIAGFSEDKITCINEPTAAAIAYGLNKKNTITKKILVFDFGGGTFDVSVLEIDGSLFDVILTAGDPHLGGDDLDNLLLDFFVKKFQNVYGKDLSSNKNAVHRLKSACVKAKHTLSAVTQAEINIEKLMDGIDFKEKITRALFNEICKDLIGKTIKIVDEALKNKNILKSDIGSVVLIGGSTRIPKVQELLSAYFDGKKLDKNLNPDEAVAIGAAMHAANIYCKNSTGLSDYLLNDIVPYDLGIRVHDRNREETMSVLIEQGSKIPFSITDNYRTVKDNQTSFEIAIYEGQSKTAMNNNLLGRFIVSDITPLPAIDSDIDVTFALDESGILNVSAVEKVSKKQNSVSVNLGTKRRSTDINNMIEISKKLRTENEENKKIVTARNGLEELCHSITNKIDEKNLDCSELADKCKEILKWLTTDSPSEDEILNKQKELKPISTDIFK